MQDTRVNFSLPSTTHVHSISIFLYTFFGRVYTAWKKVNGRRRNVHCRLRYRLGVSHYSIYVFIRAVVWPLPPWVAKADPQHSFVSTQLCLMLRRICSTMRRIHVRMSYVWYGMTAAARQFMQRIEEENRSTRLNVGLLVLKQREIHFTSE